MKKCAIILNGSDVVKVSNLKRKYNKLINNPDVKILEECEESELEDRYKYWCSCNVQKISETSDDVIKYYYKNIVNGHTITSIYPELNYIPEGTNKEDWVSYTK